MNQPASSPAPFSIRDRVIPIMTVAIVTALLALLVYGLFGGDSRTVQRQGGLNTVGVFIPIEGRQAPTFSVEGLNGERVSLEDYRGRLVVLNFWASWCPPCREEAPLFAELDRTFDDSELVVLGIAVWDDASAARDFLRQYGLTYPNALDADGRIAIAYGVAGVPETFFIGPDGRLLGKYPGAVTSMEQVNGILAELNVAR